MALKVTNGTTISLPHQVEKSEDTLDDQFLNRDDSSPKLKIGKIMHGSPVPFNFDSQIKSTHRDMSKSALTFYCSMCNFKSASQEQHEQHLNQYHLAQADMIPCTQCGALFKTPTGLKMHMEVKHTSNPTLKCPICGKSMYNKMNLDGHINQHNGVKPHVCTYCGKNFSYKQSLSAHGKMCAMKHI